MDVVTFGLLTISLFLLIILTWVWPPDSPWSPWWRTNTKKSKVAVKLASIVSKDMIYELGCGEATFLTTAVKETNSRGVGIEIELTRFIAAWVNTRLKGLAHKIKLNRSNFFEVDLRPASVVFVYLVPRVLEKLKPKFYKELRKGTKIISYKYKFKKDKRISLLKEDKKNEIYVYKIV